MNRLQSEVRSLAWWLWLAQAALLVAARMVDPWAGILALGLALAQVIGFYLLENSWDSLPVQVRVVFAVVVFTGHLPYLAPLLWLPALGAAVRVVFGYCLASRLVSLFPPHRVEPFSWALVGRTLARRETPSPRCRPPGLRLHTATPFS